MADATGIFRLLRDGADVESIMRHITAGDVLLLLQETPETEDFTVEPPRNETNQVSAMGSKLEKFILESTPIRERQVHYSL
jgi:hypothetical protein